MRDTGIGMTEDKVSDIKSYINAELKQGYGLVNVFQRLRLYYHNAVTFDIKSEYTKYTEISFSIPAKR